MRNLALRMILPAVLVAAATPLALAQDITARRDRTNDKSPPMHVYRASELMGKNVTNPKGESIGEINNIVVDVDRGQIAYAVLDFGGFLGIGNKLFAIPWSALGLTTDGKKFMLDVDKDRLKNAPGFDKNNWPNMADKKWATEVHEFYHQQPYWDIKTERVHVKMTASNEPQSFFHIQKASDLIGKKVTNPRDEKLGEVNDLAVDFERGRVAYAVIEFGGFLGLGEKLFAIPWSAVKLSNGDKDILLDADKDRLKNAPGFSKHQWPDMTDMAWARTVYGFWNQEPYWKS